jgi:hypothetical protein
VKILKLHLMNQQRTFTFIKFWCFQSLCCCLDLYDWIHITFYCFSWLPSSKNKLIWYLKVFLKCDFSINWDFFMVESEIFKYAAPIKNYSEHIAILISHECVYEFPIDTVFGSNWWKFFPILWNSGKSNDLSKWICLNEINWSRVAMTKNGF